MRIFKMHSKSAIAIPSGNQENAAPVPLGTVVGSTSENVISLLLATPRPVALSGTHYSMTIPARIPSLHARTTASYYPCTFQSAAATVVSQQAEGMGDRELSLHGSVVGHACHESSAPPDICRAPPAEHGMDHETDCNRGIMRMFRRLQAQDRHINGLLAGNIDNK